jgi:hypothetical protein
MGRPRKYRLGDVVSYEGEPAVVVDYRQDGRKRGSYRLIRLISLPAGRPYGPAVWVQSYKVDNNDWPDRRWTAVQNFRANSRLGDRGCTCQCCPHLAIPPSAVRSDGTLEGEESINEEPL